jgi:hypothetical protein
MPRHIMRCGLWVASSAPFILPDITKMLKLRTFWILLLCFVAAPAWATITVDSTASQVGNSVATVTWQHTVSGANRLLIVTTVTPSNSSWDYDVAPTSASYGGVALVPYRQVWMGRISGTQVWYLVNPPLGTADVTVNYSAAVPLSLGMSTSFNGINQATPLGVTGESDWGRTVTIGTASAGSSILSIAAYVNGTAVTGQTPMTAQAPMTQLVGLLVADSTTCCTTGGAAMGLLTASTPGVYTPLWSAGAGGSSLAIELVDQNAQSPAGPAVDAVSLSWMPYALTDPSFSWVHTCSGTDRLLVVSSLAVGPSAVTSVTYGGQALSLAQAVTDSASLSRTELWYLVNPPVGTATIQITYAGIPLATAMATSFTGMPGAQLGASANSSGSPTVSLTTVGTSSLVVAATGTNNKWGNTILDANSGMSELAESYNGSGTRALAGLASMAMMPTTTPGTYTAGWTGPSSIRVFGTVAAEFTVAADTVPPAVTSVQPSNNSTMTVWGLSGATLGGNLTVTGTVTDPPPSPSGVASVTCNGNSAVLTPSSGAGPLSFSCTVPISALGNQAINIVATDVAGNVSTFVDNINIVLDAQPPAVAVAAPASGSVVTPGSLSSGALGGTLTITGTATEPSTPAPQSGLSGVTCNGLAATLGAPVGSATSSFSCAVPMGAAGAQAVNIVAQDRAGNSAGIIVNYTLLAITGVSPATVNPGASVTLTGGGFAAGGSAPVVTLIQQGGTVAAVVTNFTDSSLTFTVPSGAVSGPVTVTVNGVSTTSAATLTITNVQPPVLALENDQMVLGTSARATLTASSSDPAGLPLTYSWVQLQGETMALSDPTSPTITFVTPPDDGTVVLALTASNGTMSTTRQITVQVQGFAGQLGLSIQTGGAHTSMLQVASTSLLSNFIWGRQATDLQINFTATDGSSIADPQPTIYLESDAGIVDVSAMFQYSPSLNRLSLAGAGPQSLRQAMRSFRRPARARSAAARTQAGGDPADDLRAEMAIGPMELSIQATDSAGNTHLRECWRSPSPGAPRPAGPAARAGQRDSASTRRAFPELAGVTG